MRHRKAGYNDKHHRRAVAALATHRCATELTDGFCGPDDHAPVPVVCHRKTRDCTVQAEGLLHSLASRGMIVLWIYDKELPPGLAAELVTIREQFDG